jgi:hypothetical protein
MMVARFCSAVRERDEGSLAKSNAWPSHGATEQLESRTPIRNGGYLNLPPNCQNTHK